MRAPSALLVAFMMLFVQPEYVGAESRIALVIGNGAYADAPLSDPPNDAGLIGNALRKLNFDVTVQTDVKQREMRHLIRDFEKLLTDNKETVGLFYYSGHGIQVDGRNYMIPIKADIMDESDVSIEGVKVDDVLSKMRYAGNEMNLIVLDACRNNPYEKRYKSPIKGLHEIKGAPQGSLIAFAAEPHKVALQGPGKYSIFTEALAREIDKPGVAAVQMLKNVRKEVFNQTKGQQLPTAEDRTFKDFFFRPIAKIDPIDREYMAMTNVRVRSGPGTHHKGLKTLKRGNRIWVKGKVAGKPWFQVEWESGAAYIFSRYLQATEPTEGTSQASGTKHDTDYNPTPGVMW